MDLISFGVVVGVFGEVLVVSSPVLLAIARDDLDQIMNSVLHPCCSVEPIGLDLDVLVLISNALGGFETEGMEVACGSRNMSFGLDFQSVPTKTA